MLRIGVVGVGHIAKHRHIPIFQKLKGVELTCLCDKEEQTVKSVAQQFGIKRYYTCLSDMLKADVDIVDITTPPQTHFHLALEAMKAGKHVLAEKPLAMSVNEVEEMYKVADKEDVRLCVVHQNIYNPVVQKARQLFSQGYIGKLISVDVGTFVRPENYMVVNENHWCHRLPGGIFFETLPHPVYLLQAFLRKARPVHVLTKKISDRHWMKAEEARITVDSEDGMGLIVASHSSPFHGDTIDLFGTKMSLHVDLWGRTIIKRKKKTEKPVSVGLNNISLASQFLGLVGTTIVSSLKVAFSGVGISAHYGFLRAYVESIVNNKEMPVSRDEAKENVSIVESSCKMIERSWEKLYD